MKCRLTVALFVFGSLLAAGDAPRKAIQLSDIISWKRIQSQTISNDGAWFAYRLSPAEGDGEVVIHNLKDGKDLRFPIGSVPRPAGNPFGPAPAAGPARDLAISGDSKWAALFAYPSAKEEKSLKKTKKPVQSHVVLVELATAKKTEFEKIRKFAFSGERSTMLGMHRYAATPPPAAPAAYAADATAA